MNRMNRTSIFGKKVLALVLTVAMLLTLTPASALALSETEGADSENTALESYDAKANSEDFSALITDVPETTIGAENNSSSDDGGDLSILSDAIPGVTIALAEGESGDTTLRIVQGVAVAEADLLVGVSAVDENGAHVSVTVKDTDELDMANPQPKGTPGEPESYLITYEAVHPVTDETFTATRECYVTLSAADIVPLAGEFQVEGGGTYNTLLAAEAAAPNGGTITLLSDVAVSSTAYLYSGKTLTLNMNGHTLSNSYSLQYLLAIYGGTRVTITGGGSFINNGGFGAAQVAGNSHLNILNGHFESAEDALYCAESTVVIAAGTFKATNDSDGCIYGSDISLAPGSTSTPAYSTLDPMYPWGYASEVTVSAATDANNAFLSALTYSVDGGTAVSVPDFNSYIYEYDVVLDPSTSPTALIGIDAVPAIPGAGISIGPASSFNLVNGEGTVEIAVTATELQGRSRKLFNRRKHL